MTDTPAPTLAPYVRILGRGPGRSRSLTQDEAHHAFALILAGDAAPEAVGALLMLMRFRGEVAPEIAGFVTALRAHLGPDWANVNAGLDWPTYAAGRTRGLPLFLLSAKLVATQTPVLLHGWNSHQNPLASVRAQLTPMGIEQVATPAEANAALSRDGIAYAPLEILSPRAYDILRLRDVLGLRSAVNTTLRMMNPTVAAASVQGVFHPSYRELQADAAALLELDALTVIKGGGGEFERHPSKSVAGFGLRSGTGWAESAPALVDDTRKLATPDHAAETLLELWRGNTRDGFAEAVITGTAGLALHTLGLTPTLAQAEEMAQSLWQSRQTT